MSARWAPAVTVAVLVERSGTFLMVEERIEGRLCLNQPAGHLEAGESLVEAATREVFEESRWRVEVTHLVGVHSWTHPDSGRSWLRFVFCAVPLDEQPGPLDPPVVAATWLTRAEINEASERHRSPLVAAALEAYDTGLRVPLEALQSLLGQAR